MNQKNLYVQKINSLVLIRLTFFKVKQCSSLSISLNLILQVCLLHYLLILNIAYANTFDIEDDSSSITLIKPIFDKDLGMLGEWRGSGVISGFGMVQSNPVQTNKAYVADLSNAMIVVEQKKGSFGFFAQIGYYDILDIGQPDQRIQKQTINSFGVVPQAQINYSIDKNLTVSIGKLSALGGYEASFSYQNLNVVRGVLWSQTSSFSEGVQIDYDNEAFSASIALTDGFYSNKFNWLGVDLSYKLSESQKIGVVWTGAVSPNNYTTNNTPLLKNNSQIVNLLYSQTVGRWSFDPYLQYTFVPANSSIGIPQSAETYGVAILANYKFTVDLDGSGTGYQKASIPFRVEYIQSTGIPGSNAPTLLYGPGSSALTLTLSPTIQYKKYFARVEVSMIRLYDFSPQLGFGNNSQNASQFRGILELGILY